MIVCNEAVTVGIGKLPVTVQTALQDLKDYQADTTLQLRRCLTRSLDVASEAILTDLDSEWSFLPRGIKTPRRAAAGKKSRPFLPCPMEAQNAKPLLTRERDSWDECSLSLSFSLSVASSTQTCARPSYYNCIFKYSASSEILSALASSRSTCEKYQGDADKKLGKTALKLYMVAIMRNSCLRASSTWRNFRETLLHQVHRMQIYCSRLLVCDW